MKNFNLFCGFFESIADEGGIVIGIACIVFGLVAIIIIACIIKMIIKIRKKVVKMRDEKDVYHSKDLETNDTHEDRIEKFKVPVHCQYCGKILPDKDSKCPNCGAENSPNRK